MQSKQSKFKPKVMKPNKDETDVKVNDIKPNQANFKPATPKTKQNKTAADQT